jgi:hypothetical protein
MTEAEETVWTSYTLEHQVIQWIILVLIILVY